MRQARLPFAKADAVLMALRPIRLLVDVLLAWSRALLDAQAPGGLRRQCRAGEKVVWTGGSETWMRKRRGKSEEDMRHHFLQTGANQSHVPLAAMTRMALCLGLPVPCELELVNLNPPEPLKRRGVA